ncbi:MAG: hypothetical protein WDN45_01630 [Caulobacteraceae bacterium]
MPVRLDTAQALEDLLPALFRRLQSEPAPQGLVDLIDRLEETYSRSRVEGEARAIARGRVDLGRLEPV